MMDRKINIFQLRGLYITATIGIGLITLPRVLVQETSTTSWLPMIIGTSIIIVIAYFILKLLSLFPRKNIFEISKIILGKYIAIVISLIFIAYFMLVASSTTRFTSDVVNIWMLPLTPVIILILTFLTIASYACSREIESLARFCTTFLFLNILSIVLVLIFTVFNLRLYNIQPFFHTNVKHLFEGTKASLLSLLGIETLFIFHKFINKENKVKSTIYKSIILIGFLYTLLVEFTIGYFGIDQIKILIFPVLSLFKTVEVQLFIFERIELFFITLWLSAAFTTISIYFYCGCHLIKEIMPKKTSKYILVLYLGGTIYLAQYPKNIQENFKLLDLAGNTGIFISILIPLLLLGVGKIRGVIK